MKLVQRIKFDNHFYYLPPKHQLVCLHHPKLNKVYKFVKRKALPVILFQKEFDKVFSFDTNRLLFLGQPMLSQIEYDQLHPDLTSEETNLLNYHLDHCKICTLVNRPTRRIRKRPKIGEEQLLLARDIGSGVSDRILGKAYNLSRTSLKTFKRKLRTIKRQSSNKSKSRKDWQFKSLTDLDKTRINQKLDQNGFTQLTAVHKDLKLPCSMSTVRNCAREIGYRRFVASEELLLSENNFELKKTFAKAVVGLTQDHVACLLFVDEKTLEASHSSKLFVYRKRGPKQRNRKCYKFIRNPQSNFKANLFGYITPYGVGDLFVFSNYTNQFKFINYLHYDVIPSIRARVGDQFVLVLDNVGFHKSKLCLEYFKRTNLNILIWLPRLLNGT